MVHHSALPLSISFTLGIGTSSSIPSDGVSLAEHFSYSLQATVTAEGYLSPSTTDQPKLRYLEHPKAWEGLVGLYRGLIHFANTFKTSASSCPNENIGIPKKFTPASYDITSDLYQTCILLPEPDFIMFLRVDICPENKAYIQHLSLPLIQRRAYASFCLFRKSFAHVLAASPSSCFLSGLSPSTTHSVSSPMIVLHERLDEFFAPYFQTIQRFTCDLQDSSFEKALSTYQLYPQIEYKSISVDTALFVQAWAASFGGSVGSPDITIQGPSPHPVSIDFRLILLWKTDLLWSEFVPADAQVLLDYLIDQTTGKISDGIVNQIKRKNEPLISSSDRGATFTGLLIGDIDPDRKRITSHHCAQMGAAGSFILSLWQQRELSICMLVPVTQRHSSTITSVDVLVDQSGRLYDRLSRELS